MLILSLILSGLLLLITNLIARNSRHAGGLIVLVSLGFLLGPPLFLGFGSPAVVLQALMLGAAAIVWRGIGSGPSLFYGLSFASALLAYAVAGGLAWRNQREYTRLRHIYPFESMEGRLAALRPTAPKRALPSAGVERLNRLERQISTDINGYRKYKLQQLHEHAVALFINSPGFGVARMGNPNAWSLASGLRREPVPRQPAPRTPREWSPGDGDQTPDGIESPLGAILEASILDFVNPSGFGYIKDRRHVTGFETHRFGQVPAPAKRWTVQTLELVSLLLNVEPAVYVSDHLPKMEPHRDVPIRPLDRFERFGLGNLRHGEDLFIASERESVRMIGAVRSTSQCMVCHDCQRGDLLGAFTYTLKREGGEKADKAE
jgi:hypothetical protein